MRASENPILTPAMVRPSSPDLEVVGVFNPGVIRHESDVLLLLRVAEAPRRSSVAEVTAPVYDAASGRVEVLRWPADTKGLDVSDPRVIVIDGRMWLTSISHLRGIAGQAQAAVLAAPRRGRPRGGHQCRESAPHRAQADRQDLPLAQRLYRGAA